MNKTQWGVVSAVVMLLALVVSLFISDTAAQLLWNIINLFFN